MKVGIIGFASLRQMPYASRYMNLLASNNIEYELITWDRFGLSESCPIRSYTYHELLDDGAPKLRKILPMFRYRAFVAEHIKKGGYDFLIVLTTIPAVILSDLLVRFEGRYILDIRDYTYEHFLPYRLALNKALSKAVMRTVSSPAFCRALPRWDYRTYHNISAKLGVRRDVPLVPVSGHPIIRINYIGAIGYLEQVQQLFQRVGNDNRFFIGIHGTGPCEEKLRKHALDKNYTNIIFTGKYTPSEKEVLLKQSDIIFNAYGSENRNAKMLLSNKLYDAAWHYKPILVSPDTEMAEASKGFGIALDYSDTAFADKLYEYYISLDWPVFHQSCDSFMARVLSENEQTELMIIDAIKKPL